MALLQQMNRFPRRAGRVFDSERDILRNPVYWPMNARLVAPPASLSDLSVRLRGAQMLFT